MMGFVNDIKKDEAEKKEKKTSMKEMMAKAKSKKDYSTTLNWVQDVMKGAEQMDNEMDLPPSLE